MKQSFWTDDVVAGKANPDRLAVIERTHADIDTHDPYPARNDPEGDIRIDKDIVTKAYRKFLRDGVPPKDTVMIRWQHDQQAQLIPESKLELVDRSLLVGDVVKRHPRDPMTGVVLNTFTKCTLQPISDVEFREDHRSNNTTKLKGLPPETDISYLFSEMSLSKAALITDIPASELKCATSPSIDDLVIYRDWIGRVTDIDSMVALRMPDNSVAEIDDEAVEHLNGAHDAFNVGDIAHTKKGTLRRLGRWIYGKYNPNTMSVGTVVGTRIITLHVRWLERRIGSIDIAPEPPVVLDREDMESEHFHVYDRTKRPMGFPGGESLTNVTQSEFDVQLNSRVRFADLSGACVKYDGSNGTAKVNRIDRKDTLGYDLNVFDIVKFRADVTVQWQDLSITRERSVDLIPDMGIEDDHDAWPGEIAHLLDLETVPSLPGVKQARKVGVVQSVNAAQRMAKIRWCPDACVQYSEDPEYPQLRDVVAGVVGFASGEVEELSLYDLDAPGQLNVRRGDMVLVSNNRPSVFEPAEPAGYIKWVGEVVDTRLDGSLTIRLGAANPVRDVNLRREDVVVAIRSDSTDEEEEWDAEELDRIRINSDDEIEVADDSERDSLQDGSDWSLDSEPDEEDVRYEDENGDPMDAEEVENEDWESESDEDEDVEMQDVAEETPLTSQSATPPDTTSSTAGTNNFGSGKGIVTGTPEPYLILETPVPSGHAFSSRPFTENATLTKRIQKEHRILGTAGNLPTGVYVRTWESRLDLLRVLFIGPEGTPYIDAPFIIDFFLPATFPSDPPQAFFHSWTVEGGLGGVGRVNPNLYEDGKICLSLLGTWGSGKGSEGWNAGKSTLLQVLVSLLGLVLVREPYYNEAGYDHVVGMETSQRASEMYSERVFLKARTFVLAALNKLGSGDGEGTGGVEGLEDVLRWLYMTPTGPKLLQKCIRDVEEVLRKSEAGTEPESGGEALPTMSKGACISLRKVLWKLKELQ